MKEFYDSFKLWLDLAQWLVTGAIGVVWWQLKRDKSQDIAMANFDKRYMDKVAEHEVRITKIEEGFKHVPKDTEMTRLTAQMEELQRAIEKLTISADRQQQFLMNNR